MSHVLVSESQIHGPYLKIVMLNSQIFKEGPALWPMKVEVWPYGHDLWDQRIEKSL